MHATTALVPKSIVLADIVEDAVILMDVFGVEVDSEAQHRVILGIPLAAAIGLHKALGDLLANKQPTLEQTRSWQAGDSLTDMNAAGRAVLDAHLGLPAPDEDTFI
jgi:hypothetical protein